MKILQVRFKNLNSLAGEWHVDLAHPDYAADGIFAITGPTGAGKSTILDAICLALYGRTPRLARVTKSGNEIMSRQTGDCFSEVTFETQEGRYRCHWSQRRARKKSDGELQAPKHEIANADTGEIFEASIRGVADRIESATGMDFDRFTRSMLLAQGGFAAFLQAAPDGRAPILEQITGTEIYSQISIRVHERQRDERDQLKQLLAETAGITILEPEQEQEKQQALEARQKDESLMAAQSTVIEKAVAWLTTIDGLKKEIGGLAEEGNKLKGDMDAFKPDRDTLERALSAAALDGAYATLSALRQQQTDDQAALATDRAALPDRESSAHDQAEALTAAERTTQQAKDALKTAAPLIQQVRSLDQTRTELAKAVEEGAEDCAKEAAKIDTDKQARQTAQEQRTTAETALAGVEQYLKINAKDEWLIGGLAGIEEQFDNLLSKQGDITQKEAELKMADAAASGAVKKLEDATRQCAFKQQELKSAAENLRQEKNTLSALLEGKLLREYRIEKETLLREMAYRTKIAELEDHRAKLEDGTPCPLCGAVEHPYAQGNIPALDEIEQKIETLTELIDKAEALEATINKLEQAETAARNNLNDSEKLEVEAANNKRAAEKTCAELKQTLTKLGADFVDLKLSVSKKLKPLGISDLPESGIESVLETLRLRLTSWQEQVKQKTDIEKQRSEIDSELKRLNAVIDTQSSALAAKQKQLTQRQKDLAAVEGQRKQLYGDKQPDTEEARLSEAIAAAEVAEKKARELNNELQRQLTTARTQIESLTTRIERREPELLKAQNDFFTALVPAGFADEPAFLEARLTQEQRNVLSVRAKELDDRHTDLSARQNDRQARLRTEEARKVTDKSLEELEPKLKENEAALNGMRDDIAALNHEIRENEAAKERIKEKQAAIDAQKKECRRWDNLHDLIGSADGKKFRNFAQGLTFEIMVGYANRQLQKMTDRYLLTRDTAQPLELNVVDNYQAGEIRSTKNLSGGESFVVSLSLALGLSHMASKNVRVDSLFLDEGFGTLDEEALDTALETLAGLQQDGKLIGVISHVNALKERIGTQIQVTPLPGGKSRISGPGCYAGAVEGGA